MGNRKKKDYTRSDSQPARNSDQNHWSLAAVGLSIVVFSCLFLWEHLVENSYSQAYKAQYELLVAKGDDYKQVLDVYNQCKNRGSLRFTPSLMACQDEAELSAKYITLKTPISVIMRDLREAEAFAFISAQ